MFEASKFVQNELSGPVSNDRLLVAALNLEHVISIKTDESKKLDYLNLAITVQNKKNPLDEYEILFIRYNYEHIKEFMLRHLNESNHLHKFLNKFLKIHQLLKKENFDHLVFIETVIQGICLMFRHKIQDGILVMGFLNLIPRHSTQFEFLLQRLKAPVWLFMLDSVKSSAHQSHPLLYKEMLDVFPLDLCDFSYDFHLMPFFIQYGHGFQFPTEERLLHKVAFEFRRLFSHSLYDMRGKIVEKFSLVRIYFILMVCLALKEEKCGPRETMLTVVKLLWKTMPHPFITSQEIEDILGILVPREEKEKVRVFRLKFEQEFGNSSPTPRSLKHLSRCKIRKDINLRGKLPEDVKHLPVPPVIKKYLLLEG